MSVVCVCAWLRTRVSVRVDQFVSACAFVFASVSVCVGVCMRAWNACVCECDACLFVCTAGLSMLA